MDAEHFAEEVLEATDEAEAVLTIAVLHFIARNKDARNNAFRLLGMEFALVRAAARIALIQEGLGAKNTRSAFMQIARLEFSEAAKDRPKAFAPPKPSPEPKPKLKVVK